jgi:hypothetical protein
MLSGLEKTEYTKFSLQLAIELLRS